MAARLGNVMAIANLAGLFTAGTFFFWYVEPSIPEAQPLKDWMLAWAFRGVGISIGSWVIGRVSLHVLAGR